MKKEKRELARVERLQVNIGLVVLEISDAGLNDESYGIKHLASYGSQNRWVEEFTVLDGLGLATNQGQQRITDLVIKGEVVRCVVEYAILGTSWIEGYYERIGDTQWE